MPKLQRVACGARSDASSEKCTWDEEQRCSDAHVTAPFQSLIAWAPGLRKGPAPEARLFDDGELQVLVQLGEWAATRANRNRDCRELVFVDEANGERVLG